MAHTQQKRFLRSRSQTCWREHQCLLSLVALFPCHLSPHQTCFASSASSSLPLLGVLFPLGSPIRFSRRLRVPIQPWNISVLPRSFLSLPSWTAFLCTLASRHTWMLLTPDGCIQLGPSVLGMLFLAAYTVLHPDVPQASRAQQV